MNTDTHNLGAERTDCGRQVICVWCGGVIRGGVAKDSKRMCQPCFARMMREHSRAHMARSPLNHASER
jgi:hypothetical protein